MHRVNVVIQVDFLLTAMRQLAAARPDLKLILMSATVNPEGLMEYFEGAVQGEHSTVTVTGTALSTVHSGSTGSGALVASNDQS